MSFQEEYADAIEAIQKGAAELGSDNGKENTYAVDISADIKLLLC